jgi:hypothetical protein
MVQNDVLLEIFKSNMALQRGVEVPGSAAATPVGDATPAGDTPSSESPAGVGAEAGTGEEDSSRPAT